MRKQAIAMIVGLALINSSSMAVAGWLGPSTYDECVFEKAKEAGVAASSLRNVVARLCREKFPDKPTMADKPMKPIESKPEKSQEQILADQAEIAALREKMMESARKRQQEAQIAESNRIFQAQLDAIEQKKLKEEEEARISAKKAEIARQKKEIVDAQARERAWMAQPKIEIK